jgi:thymidylate synthase
LRKINFQYNIEWSSVTVFNYRSFENDLVKYDAYLNMENKMEHLASIINKDKNSRRAICFSDGVENPGCMSSIQFLMEDKTIHMICNFRSQHKSLGRPSDEIMVKFLATKFVNSLEQDFDDLIITCNVADYHEY